MTYADSSFVVSIYRTSESVSERARWQINRVPYPVLLTPLSLLEIRNSFNMAIGRGEIGEAERKSVMADIEQHIKAGFFRMAEVSQADIYAKACELSDLHTPAMLTRSLDLMHVAAALLCKARVFLSTDIRQRTAAKAEGLEVKP